MKIKSTIKFLLPRRGDGFIRGVAKCGLIAWVGIMGLAALGLLLPDPPPPTAAELSEMREMEREIRELEREVERGKKEREKRERERERAAARQQSWSTTGFTNEWGEQAATGARSQAVPPVTPMGFPYHDLTGTILVQCPSNVAIRFNDQPNLTGGSIRDGYTDYTLSARIDGRDVRYSVTQGWGDDDLNFRNAATVRQAIMGGNEIEILLPWYGEGNVRFRWSLDGSSSAIQSSCG